MSHPYFLHFSILNTYLRAILLDLEEFDFNILKIRRKVHSLESLLDVLHTTREFKDCYHFIPCIA